MDYDTIYRIIINLSRCLADYAPKQSFSELLAHIDKIKTTCETREEAAELMYEIWVADWKDGTSVAKDYFLEVAMNGATN